MAGPGKCFLVTGPPGVGKSTLIMRVFETIKASNPTLKASTLVKLDAQARGLALKWSL
ncbi:P-loop containing nucleoside triphosphate hydrolase [Sesbania bispinosa]|nr:P-loop containing nucleoside triphosphate hydrolase [Sesbania bispinosa]